MKQEIGIITSIALVGVALIFDGIQALLTLSVFLIPVAWFMSALAWIIFLLWFLYLGVSYFDKGGALRLLTALAAIVTELLPIINALPGLTIGVVALIVQHNLAVKREERRPGKVVDKSKLTQQVERLARIRNRRREQASGGEPVEEAA